MRVSIEDLKDTTKGRRRKIVVTVIMMSVAIHLLGGAGAAIWIVARYISQPEAVFTARKTTAIPPQLIDPKMAAAEFDAAAPKPQLDQKIASLRESAFALPDVPMVETQEPTQFDPSSITSESIEGLADALGSGGTGQGGGGGGGGSAISFFGLQQQSRNVVYLLDLSLTMVGFGKGPQDFERLQAETEKSIRGLQPSTKFNLIAYAKDRHLFQSAAVPASPENVEKAIRWMERHSPARILRDLGNMQKLAAYDGGKHLGTRADLALLAAMKMSPDLVILVSDGAVLHHAGGPPKTRLKDQTEVSKDVQIFQLVRENQMDPPVVISTISYKCKGKGLEFMKNLAKQNGGQFRQIK